MTRVFAFGVSMSYMNELLARVVAIQKEAMASLTPPVPVDSVPRFNHVQEAFPYFTNRIADTPVSDDGSQDEDVNSPILLMRLVVDHVTSGYRGEVEAKLYTWLPVIKTYFNERMWLQSAAYPLRMENLQSARVINSGGLRIFDNAGIAAVQVGAELQLQCIFPEFIEQVYY
jgi:hypothetical protein